MSIQYQPTLKSLETQRQAIDAAKIAKLDHQEAAELAAAELDRFLAVVDRLDGNDWQQPTDCTLWSVRDIVSHQAGGYASFASWADFWRTMSVRPAKGQLMVDAINDREVADRADRSHAEVVDELRQVGTKAIRTRARLPWLLRKVVVPFGSPLGTRPIEYLTDLIYTRDTWSHRLDICRAAGLPFEQSAEHDGRLLALVMRDLAAELADKLGGQSVIFDIGGVAGDRYQIGADVEPSAVIKIDLLELMRLSSDRTTPEALAQQGALAISGDRAFAEKVLANTSVPY